MTTPKSLFAALVALCCAETASAGWDNAFQVACFRCRRERTSAYYAPPPQPVVAQRPPATSVTEYERHCEYEPITVMKPEVYQQPVQVQERRSYYEPSTTYTTRSYYNPETCRTESYQEPRTCMVRKEECNTVTKYIERTRMVPVQTQRKVCYTTPKTTITQYGPPTKSYECDNCELPQSQSPPRVNVSPGAPPNPNIPATPGIGGDPMSQPKPMPSNQSNYRGPFTTQTVSRTAGVQGEVVTADGQTPMPNAEIVFLASDLKTRVVAKADAYGQFDAKVPTGDWHVYLSNGQGKADLYQTVKVTAAGKQFTVVSR